MVSLRKSGMRLVATLQEAERQYRQSMQLADQQQRMQAQQLAEQRFQSNLAAWSIYMQSVNARQPQTVHLDGTIRIQ